MGYLKYMKKAFEEKGNDMMKDRMIAWRREPATLRLERPTRIDRARALGYKPKQGVFVVRQRVNRGGKMRPKHRKGRRSKHMRRKKVLDISYQVIAEQRASKKYNNCEVINSYFVGKDGEHYWYEVILADRNSPVVKADRFLSNVIRRKDRVGRGLTSAARKSRGQRRKGIGTEKSRPSKRAHWNK